MVVTEARLKRGANITAAFGLHQNREVFALPGRVDSEASAGTNRLISRQHAKLISMADEILEELRFGRVKSQYSLLPLGEDPKVTNRKVFSDLEQKVLKQIENGTEELDDIHANPEYP